MKRQWRFVVRSILSFTLCLPVSDMASANEDSDPHAWLDRMSHASREQSYQGVFTYEQDAEIVSLSIAHTVTDGIERERLFHLTGEPREVIRHGHKVTCLHPGNKLVRLDRNIPAGPFAKTFSANLSEIDKYYELSMAGNDRIAGRDVIKLDIVPRDAYRFGYQLLLDRESGLLLESRMVTATGETLERFQFATIEIGKPIPEDALKATTAGQVVAHHHQLITSSDHTTVTAENKHKHGWYPSWLPGGFTIAAGDILRGPLYDQTMDSLMYTDGLAVFSIFVEKAGNNPENTSIRRGGTIIYSRQQVLKTQPYRVTVVGEVPEVTAEKLAHAVSMH